MKSFLQTNNFLKLISAHLPDMLWAKDVAGNYLFANQAICKNLLMAKDTNEPIGKSDIFFALRERELITQKIRSGTPLESSVKTPMSSCFKQ